MPRGMHRCDYLGNAVRELCERYRRECANIGVDYVSLNTSQPFDKALVEYLSATQKPAVLTPHRVASNCFQQKNVIRRFRRKKEVTPPRHRWIGHDREEFGEALPKMLTFCLVISFLRNPAICRIFLSCSVLSRSTVSRGRVSDQHD